jgi:transposase
LLGFGAHARARSACQRKGSGVHDWSQREIRDLPVFDAETVLVVWRARAACPTCGPMLEALDWLEPHARVTNRLAESVARMCMVMPIKRVAEHYGLHWGTVKDILSSPTADGT